MRALAGGDGSDEASASLLRRAFLWWDPSGSGPDAFRWPIADVVDGQLTAVPAALFAAATELAGEDHGLDEAELAQARDEVGFYYRRLDRVPPWGGRPSGAAPYAMPGSGLSAVAPEAPVAEVAPAADPPIEQEAQMPEITPELREALGVGEDADLDTIVSRARELASPATAEQEAPAAALSADAQRQIETLTETVSKLSAQVEAVTAVAEKGKGAHEALFARDRDALLAQAVRDGKLSAAELDDREVDGKTVPGWRSHYNAAPQMVESMLASMGPRDGYQPGEIGEDGEPTAAEFSADDEAAVAALVPRSADPTLTAKGA